MAKSQAKEAAKYAGGIILAAALLFWVLRDVNPEQLKSQLANASIWGLLAAAVINLSQNFFRVWRWRALLAPVREGVPFRPLFSAVILGYLVSWVIPGRLGEVLRPALLSGREEIPLAPCLGSVVADRVLDAVTIVALFAVGLWTTPLQGQAAEHAASIRLSGLLMVAVLGGALVALVLLSRSREAAGGWVERRSGGIRWVGRVLLSLSGGTDALRRPRLLGIVLFNSLCVWLTISLGLWIGIRACAVDIPFAAVLIMMPLIALGVALPTPGGAGGFHYAIAFGLSLFAVDATLATGAAILVHLIVFIPILLLGPALIAIDRVPVGDLLRAARQIRELGAEGQA